MIQYDYFYTNTYKMLNQRNYNPCLVEMMEKKLFSLQTKDINF